MIKLKLAFGKDDFDHEFEIETDELLSAAIERATERVPKGEFKTEEIFNVLVNGVLIDDKFWDKIKLVPEDNVYISPKIKGGSAGEIFKQALLIVITVVASVFLTPAGGATVWSALAVAGVTIAASLALNALIPPPTPDLGGMNGGGLEGSQMYSITGQSNQIKRLGVVPKVYGSHRMFPVIAANPYTELSVDRKTGETVQYLCAVYDFGLGTPLISEIKIGDTPLATESFKDFQFNLVDPNMPDEPVDEFDETLEKEFRLYKGDRTFTPLSLALINGTELTQNTDDNPKNYKTEIILDLQCQRGLFGYSSSGEIGDRTINMTLEFAPVGSSDWRAYNDLTVVDKFQSVGGTDDTEFKVNPIALLPTHPLFDTYYYKHMLGGNSGSYNSPVNVTYNIYTKPNSNLMIFPRPGVNDTWTWAVGTKVFIRELYVGVIQAVNNIPGYSNYQQIVIDRNRPNKLTGYYIMYGVKGNRPLNGPVTYSSIPNTFSEIYASRNTLGAATVKAKSNNTVYANFRFTPKAIGQFKVRLRRVSTTGKFTKQTQDDITWVGLTTSFVSSPIRTTKRHVFLELRIKATNQLNGQIQNLSALVTQPLDVYDPDTNTWSRQPSNNPAWVFVDLLTGEVNKKAVSKDRIHLPSILAWAEYCDAVPTPPPGQEYLEPRFQCNFILDYESTLQEVLNQVGGASQASLNIIDGKYGVFVDRLKTVPVQIFTPRNSKDFSSSRFYAPRPHGVKVKYIDPQLAWEVTECIVYDNGYDADTATEFDDLTSFACTNYEQAWRFGRYMIAQNRLRQETINLMVDFENLVCTRGDYVQITQDVMQVGGRPARVKAVAGNVITIDDGLDTDPGLDWGYTYRSATGEIATSTCTPLTSRTYELDGDIPGIGDLIVIGEVGKLVLDCIIKSISPNDDMSAQLTLIERANDIFAYESESVLPDYDPQISQTSSPEFAPPKAVTDLEITDLAYECSETQSGYNYYIEIVWDIPANSIYEFFEILLDDGRGYRTVGTTGSKYWKQTLDPARFGVQHGMKVLAVSASGRKLDLIAVPEVLFDPTLKVTPPSNVPGFGMSITNQVLQLAWQGITDCDLYRYELRYSPDINDIWEASVPLQLVDRNVNSVAVQARTGIYFIKAVDFAGNKSAIASTSLTTIPGLFDLNIIETLNDAPNFEGNTELAIVSGTSVILEERVFGDIDTMEYYPDGYYYVKDLIDLGEIYSVRLQSLIRADGFRFGELMSNWESLEDVDQLSTANSDDWNIVAEYRATNEILSMASWEHLADVEHLNEGLGQGFTEWRPIPTIGDATGRVFQFRVHLQSITPNVTPRLFDGTIKADMPDRIETFENLLSSAISPYQVTYARRFNGPDPSPNIQITIDDGAAGDYWEIENKNLEGFQIRFYNSVGTQVVRTFDVAVKGYGSRHSVVI